MIDAIQNYYNAFVAKEGKYRKLRRYLVSDTFTSRWESATVAQRKEVMAHIRDENLELIKKWTVELDFDQWDVLRERCRQAGVAYYSRMTREQMIEALKELKVCQR